MLSKQLGQNAKKRILNLKITGAYIKQYTSNNSGICNYLYMNETPIEEVSIIINPLKKKWTSG